VGKFRHDVRPKRRRTTRGRTLNLYLIKVECPPTAPVLLADVKRHRGVAVGTLDPVVLDLEGDTPPVERDQAAVRDGDAVGVARQIGERGLGASEWALGVAAVRQLSMALITLRWSRLT